MNVVDLEKMLIKAARQERPSDKVPFAFEKRIMELVRPLPAPDSWGLWASALWRAAVPCLALMVALSVWSFVPRTSAPASSNLPQDMDNTVLAAIDQEQAVEVPQ